MERNSKNYDKKKVLSGMLAVLDNLEKGKNNSWNMITQIVAADAHAGNDFDNAIKYYKMIIEVDSKLIRHIITWRIYI